METEKKLTPKLIYILVATLLLVLLLMLRLSADVSEFMSRTLSRFWIFLFSNMTSVFPFSVFELLIAAVVVAMVVLVVFAIVFLLKHQKRRVLNGTLILISTAMSVAFVYTLATAFPYNRSPADIPMYASLPSAEEAKSAADYYLDDFNRLALTLPRDQKGNVALPYDIAALGAMIAAEYDKIDSDYFSDYTPTAKTFIFSDLISYFGLTGVFFAPTGEVNINGNTPACDLPVTVAHELAHAKGVMREYEANLVAYYVLINSEDAFLRYSAYMSVYPDILETVYYAAGFDDALYTDYKAKLADEVLVERQNARRFWKDYSGPLEKVSRFFNDLYLKLSGEDGIGSYYEEPALEDTGKVDADGNIIYVVREYTSAQKMLLENYFRAA